MMMMEEEEGYNLWKMMFNSLRQTLLNLKNLKGKKKKKKIQMMKTMKMKNEKMKIMIQIWMKMNLINFRKIKTMIILPKTLNQLIN